MTVLRDLVYMGLSLYLAPSLATGQSLAKTKTLWSTDSSEVPAAAREVDRMTADGRFKLARTQRDGQIAGRIHERMNQYHRGVRVIGGQLVWQKESGLVLSITGKRYKNIRLEVTPSLTEHEASERALIGTEKDTRVVGQTELVVLPLQEGFHLAYSLHLRDRDNLFAIYVDAHSGAVLLRYDDHRSQNAVGLGVGTWADEKKMSVEMAAGTYRAVDRLRPFGIKTYNVGFDFPAWNEYRAKTDAFLATDSDNEWRDGAVVDAHTFSGYTYDYYFKRHGRNGIDDQGLAAVNFVHFIAPGRHSNGAFYDSTDNSTNYGDGDGVTFVAFSSSLEVVAHELTHAVTRATSDLIYLNESGALNEAFSDIMGTAVEFFFQPPGSERQMADWLLGEDLFIEFGSAFRSLENPMSVGDPDHYSIRCLPPVCTERFDNGGVHINSSIANHAFYLMVDGGVNRTSGITVNGLGRNQMDRIESIFYRAFAFYLVPSSGFADARQATLRAASELYGQGSPEERVVADGWRAVGVE